MRAEKRLWRTAKGDLVEDGHPDAVTLAYGEDDNVRDGETIRTSAPSPKAGKATPKKAAAPTPKPGD
ncbi:hypothetical protein [Pimelobacter simplex]|uniref:hypothetical protein n=1 Tax=Nocardioides simplex TaxID=2045 RepID=UPI00214F7A81|nr:hypothetical protein [Pimelobacter simplex]UUW87404.1 hypothetical protein M0M43_16815 [Pimelobacter simplex]UUW96909.1 hypothetical protein M0M48_05460 [Pimelobacter simplex]